MNRCIVDDHILLFMYSLCWNVQFIANRNEYDFELVLAKSYLYLLFEAEREMMNHVHTLGKGTVQTRFVHKNM